MRVFTPRRSDVGRSKHAKHPDVWARERGRLFA
jgi:hypothetical protein